MLQFVFFLFQICDLIYLCCEYDFFYHFDFQTLIYSVAKVIVSLMRFQLRDAFSKTASIDII